MPSGDGRGAARPPLFQPILAGLVGSLPFQNHAPGALVLCSLVPFFLLLRVPVFRYGVRGALRVGWLFGFGYFAGLLYWIGLLHETQIPVRSLALGGMFILSAYLALFPAFFAAAVRRTDGRVPFLLAAPILWGALEHLRTLGALGFPWGAIGYGLMDHVTLVQAARFGSVDVLGFAVVLVNALMAEVILLGARRRIVPLLLRFGAALLVVFALGVDGVRVIRAGVRGAGPPRTVALVQPNIRAEEKWDDRYKEETIAILADLTRKAAAEGNVDLVVWPETAVPVYVRHEHRYFEEIRDLAAETGVPLLFGFPDAEYDDERGYRYFNAALLLDPEGDVLGEYRKIHLVPFGERLPLDTRVGWIGRLNLGEADFTPGDEYTVFRGRGAPFSVNICFEAIFPSLCREFVRRGATFLVNLTNDAWFGTTPAPMQHAHMARLRAVELGVYLARSANTGISLVADPFGRVVASLGLFERGVVTARIVPTDGDTFYARHGDWFPRGEMVLALLLLAAAGLPRRRRTASEGHG